MRTDCKNYETRTYASGETVRMCRIDLAPDAPWKCPDDCPGYRRKITDAGWTHGSLATSNEPVEDLPGLPEDASDLLDDAENVINSVGPEILEEIKRERAARQHPSFFKKLFRRKNP